jgi:hypothetical protein
MMHIDRLYKSGTQGTINRIVTVGQIKNPAAFATGLIVLISII